MSHTKPTEEQDCSSKNDHLQRDKLLGDDSKKLSAPEVFLIRNSVLTDLMQVNHLQSVYNISVAVCSLLFLSAVIFYIADPSSLLKDLDVIRKRASKLTYFVILWFVYNLFALAVYEGFKLWVFARTRIHAKVADGLFLLFYIFSLISMYVGTAYTLLKVGIPPITGLATGCEQVRIFMKIYSFVREKVPRVIRYDPKKDGKQKHVLYPSRSHYIYYFFIPALIYKDTYPREEKIHWNKLLVHLFKFVAVIFIFYCIFMRFNVDVFQNVGREQFNRRETALILAGSMAAGAATMLLLFYGLLHCWFIIFAELTRFGDQEFYQDWWNSTSFSEFYRKWNTVVHHWLHAYIHTELQRFGCSRTFSMISVFFLSAFAHEYIMSLALGFFYPALFVSHFIGGVSLVFLTKHRTNQFWNIFMWSMLFFGWGMLVFGYSTEWFARQNCPTQIIFLFLQTMSHTKPAEEQVSSTTNHHLRHDKLLGDDSKKLSAPKKVFHIRNSVLTDLMQVNHLQSVYNICVAVCSLLFLNAVIFYLADPSSFSKDLDVIRKGASKLTYFVIMWLTYNLFALAVYEGFKLWIFARTRIHAKVADGLFSVFYIFSLISMYIGTAYTILKVGIPPITGFATVCEQVRIFMKIYSFVRENVSRVTRYDPKKDGKQEQSLYPSRCHYIYYLFIPALIYKDTYPRTEKIHWDNLLVHLLKFFCVIFILYCIFMRFNVDIFQNVGREQFNGRETALIIAGSMAAGAATMFLIFYGLLHCWLNVFAELTRFGDKEFYQDWWNSTSFSQYYRRWNTVVYDWLHAYIYTETQRFGCSRAFSMISVFLVSAFVHEYVMSLALGFFYPALSASHFIGGVPLIFLTKQKANQFWNTFMWCILFFGFGVLIFGYSSEWFARQNCPKQETTLDFFIPRTWDSSCSITNFSS